MTTAQRSNVVSSFTIIKGAMIPETYEVLAQWDFELDKKANLDRLRDENYIGAASRRRTKDWQVPGVWLPNWKPQLSSSGCPSLQAVGAVPCIWSAVS